MEKIIITSPITKKVIKEIEPADTEEILEKMKRAKEAFLLWKNKTVKQRLRTMKNLRNIMVESLDRIVEDLAVATGKTDMDILTGDVMTCLETIKYYQKHAKKILAPKRREGGILFLGSKFYVQHHPIGVVAIFSPWNFPLQLSLIPVITALISGNAVMLKPSEVTPTVGDMVKDLCQKAGVPTELVQVIHGAKETGQKLIQAKPDKIFFTGSVAAGKSIMKAASENLIPIELELGGKDPMIVFADANFERAVKGAVYGAFTNAGQVCVSVERLYVERPIYNTFVDAVKEEVKKIKVGFGKEADVGGMISMNQIPIIDAQIQNALDNGANLVSELKKDDRFYYPVILKDVNHTMDIMREETFGPVLPIMPFDKEEEVIELANDSEYGLNSSVWTRNIRKARRVASQINAGSCAVNDVIKNITNPSMPFGGEKHSGFGRYHGPEGLYSFSRQQSLMVHSGRGKKELNWFPYNTTIYNIVRKMMLMLYADKTLKKVRNLMK